MVRFLDSEARVGVSSAEVYDRSKAISFIITQIHQ